MIPLLMFGVDASLAQVPSLMRPLISEEDAVEDGCGVPVPACS